MKRFKSHPVRRDLMRMGLRVPLDRIDAPASYGDYMRCPHCYQSNCECEGPAQRHPRYSAADYMPYQMTEDDMIACIDLLNSQEER